MKHALAGDSGRAVPGRDVPGRDVAGRGVAVHPLEVFGRERCDAVINAAGPGDPARLRQAGADILRITETLDNLVLDHLRTSPGTVYIYLGTGAVYGNGYAEPVDEGSRLCLPVNRLGPEHCYPLAKLAAEAKHRCLAHLPIVDLRVFGFVSRHLDPDAGFLLSDALRALQAGQVLETTRRNFIRDFIGPQELGDLVERAIACNGPNGVCDAVSAGPLRKSDLLEVLAQAFGLRYEIVDGTGFDPVDLPGWGPLSCIGAQAFDYRPTRTALRIVLDEMAELLGRPASDRSKEQDLQ